MKNRDYDRIEKAILYLEGHWPDQPGLEDTARAVGLSPFHFQRLFRRWAGISPKRFLQYLTAGNAKRRLRESQSLLEAAYDSGLSGPGRLHDLFVSVEAMTPGEYKSQGEGLSIGYGFHETPFGKALVAVTSRGVCGFSFLGDKGDKPALEELKSNWPKSRLTSEKEKTGLVLGRLFDPGAGRGKLQILLKGTAFQIKVWEALLRIPPGAVCAYKDVAKRIGVPKASRAVGTAIGQNPIAYLIPCHRVIRETGVIGDYRWGTARKKAILAWEEAKST